MTFREISTYIPDPGKIHRALRPSSLDFNAENKTMVYNIRDCASKTTWQAMEVGAVRGLSFSRRYLDVASPATDFLLGNGSQLPLSFRNGILPYSYEVGTSLYSAAVAPRFFSILAPAVHKTIKFFSQKTNNFNSMTRNELQNLENTILRLCIDMPLLPSLLAYPVIVGSLFTSAGIKVLINTPAALIGAAVGGIMHHKASIPKQENTENLGLRGSRNDETFVSLTPVSAIPSRFFFLSDDDFAFDVRDLALAFRANKPWHNYHSQTRFSAHDIARLNQHQTGLFNQIPETSNTIFETSWLTRTLWEDLGFFFLEVSRSLQSADHQLRSQGIQAFNDLLSSSDVSAQGYITAFMEKVSCKSLNRALLTAKNDANEAYELGEKLFAASYLSIDINSMRVDSDPPYPDHLVHFTSNHAKCISFQIEHATRRLPWLSYVTSKNSSYPGPQEIGPINLSIPELTRYKEEMFKNSKL